MRNITDIVFDSLIDHILAIYQDVLTTYSKKEEIHCNHLEKIFKRALEYMISLNPKKCEFGVIEENLLGHIVSKEGVRIDHDKVQAIDNIKFLKTIK